MHYYYPIFHMPDVTVEFPKNKNKGGRIPNNPFVILEIKTIKVSSTYNN